MPKQCSPLLDDCEVVNEVGSWLKRTHCDVCNPVHPRRLLLANSVEVDGHVIGRIVRDIHYDAVSLVRVNDWSREHPIHCYGGLRSTVHGYVDHFYLKSRARTPEDRVRGVHFCNQCET